MKLLKTIASTTEFCTGGCTGLYMCFFSGGPVWTSMCDIQRMNDILIM